MVERVVSGQMADPAPKFLVVGAGALMAFTMVAVMVGRSEGVGVTTLAPATPTVDRITTLCGPVLRATAAPMSRTTASIASIDVLPSAALGVPTAIIDTSVSATARAVSVVARSRPAATASAISSAISASTIGDRPAPSMATFSGATSTPSTSWPRLARHPPETAPT